MKKQLLFAVLIVMGLSLILASCSPAAKPAESAAPVASSGSVSDNPGKTVLESKCATCHDLGRVESAKKTEAEWTATVERMITKGTKLSADEKANLINYLAETYK